MKKAKFYCFGFGVECMRNDIIIKSLVIIILITLFPTVSAVEFSEVNDILKTKQSMINIDVEELRSKYLNSPAEPTIILLFLLSILLNILRVLKFSLPIMLIIMLLQKIFGNTTAITI
jgi:hypothetical protein